MNRFHIATPRAALGLFAAAMTVFTIGIAVVAPAKMDVSAQQERFTADAAKATFVSTANRASRANPQG